MSRSEPEPGSGREKTVCSSVGVFGGGVLGVEWGGRRTTDTHTRHKSHTPITYARRTLLRVAALSEGLELRLLDAHHLHEREELHRVPPQVVVEVAHRLLRCLQVGGWVFFFDGRPSLALVHHGCPRVGLNLHT